MPALPAGMVASRPSIGMQKERRMRRHVRRAWLYVWRLSPRLDHRNKVDGVYRHHTHQRCRAWRHRHLSRTSSCSAILKWPIQAVTEHSISFYCISFFGCGYDQGYPAKRPLQSKSGFGPQNMVQLACGGQVATSQEKKPLSQDTVKKSYK